MILWILYGVSVVIAIPITMILVTRMIPSFEDGDMVDRALISLAAVIAAFMWPLFVAFAFVGVGLAAFHKYVMSWAK